MEPIIKTLLLYEETRELPAEIRREKLKTWLEDTEVDPLCKIPYLMMEDTLFGKKEQYFELAKMWTAGDCPAESWVLLTLIDTIEEMSVMIFELYRDLGQLFSALLKQYLEENKEPDVIAALTILKACDLEVISPERYVAAGKTKLGNVHEEDLMTKYALARLQKVNDMWGGL